MYAKDYHDLGTPAANGESAVGGLTSDSTA